MNCLLHKREECCTLPVKTNKELIARLKHLIGIDEMNVRHKPDGEEKTKILNRIQDNTVWFVSLEKDFDSSDIPFL